MKRNRSTMNYPSFKFILVIGVFQNLCGALPTSSSSPSEKTNFYLNLIEYNRLNPSTNQLNNSISDSDNKIVRNYSNVNLSDSYNYSDKLVYPLSGCKNCENKNKNTINHNELVRLRVEFEKNQILKKLRLKERPVKIHGHHNHSFIPKSLIDGLNYNNDLDHHDMDEDYYAKTTQKVIFPNEDNQCNNLIGRIYYKNCYKFELVQQNDEEEINVSLAELWFYTGKPGHHTYAINQINGKNLTKSLIGVYRRRSHSMNGGEWGKIDLKHVVAKWNNDTHIINQIIEIECMTCDAALNHGHEYKPFIVIDMKPSESRLHRKKRSLDCSSTDGSECCREKLYISFADIGWDDWIIFPAGYDAYYCKGSCSTAASVTLSSAHNQAIRKVFKNRKTKGIRNLELIPCCTASKYSSLQLIYMDSNKLAIHKILPNMVVEECGCN